MHTYNFHCKANINESHLMNDKNSIALYQCFVVENLCGVQKDLCFGFSCLKNDFSF